MIDSDNAQCSFADVMDDYGVNSDEQKMAFYNLLQRASIIPNGTSFEEAFPPGSEQDLVMEMFRLIKATQEKFTIRTGTQERWEVQPLDWMRENEEAILHDLRILGFVDAIKPKAEQFDAV